MVHLGVWLNVKDLVYVERLRYPRVEMKWNTKDFKQQHQWVLSRLFVTNEEVWNEKMLRNKIMDI